MKQLLERLPLSQLILRGLRLWLLNCTGNEESLGPSAHTSGGSWEFAALTSILDYFDAGSSMTTLGECFTALFWQELAQIPVRHFLSWISLAPFQGSATLAALGRIRSPTKTKQLWTETLSLEGVGIINMIKYQLLSKVFSKLSILTELRISDNHLVSVLNSFTKQERQEKN